MNKILVIGHSSYNYPFEEYGEVTNEVSEILSCDLVVFTGGEDVSPELYGEEEHPLTQSNSYRDEQEISLFELAESYKIPMVGICRGAQFLCVMNGGKLEQHIEQHGYHHPIYDIDSELVVESATSSHHQEMIPDLADSDVVAIGDSNGVHTVEAVVWPLTTSLGVQFHPEWTDEDSQEMKYFRILMDRHILTKIAEQEEADNYDKCASTSGC